MCVPEAFSKKVRCMSSSRRLIQPMPETPKGRGLLFLVLQSSKAYMLLGSGTSGLKVLGLATAFSSLRIGTMRERL